MKSCPQKGHVDLRALGRVNVVVIMLAGRRDGTQSQERKKEEREAGASGCGCQQTMTAMGKR